MSAELAAIDWIGRGWLLLLSFTAAALVVAALRRGCRRLFGTERAFQLWLLPPLAMLASQLPHLAAAPVVVVPSAAQTFAVAAVLPAQAAQHGMIDGLGFIAALWIAGTLFSLCVAVARQWRYRLRMRDAVEVTGLDSRWPVWRAGTVDVGPALVGAWRSRIVLPADFERRYDAVEQALILAHENLHAQRRDGWWCLLARCVAALFWFHPLAWWALAALRHDQELACDAAVLRMHGEQRRSYANAMLKTQSAAFALPVGCSWSPRHPVTERIAMLKLKQPGPFRRRAGGLLFALLAIGMGTMVYATTPAPPETTGDGMSGHYTLKIEVASGGHPDSMYAFRCVNSGEYTDPNGMKADDGLSWEGRFEVSPAADGQLEVRAKINTRFDRGNGDVRTKFAEPIVRTMPGQKASIVFGETVSGKQRKDVVLEDDTIRFGLTPSVGCDSRSLSPEWYPATAGR